MFKKWMYLGALKYREERQKKEVIEARSGRGEH